ncbi:hypothetical protein TNCV_1149471 [Trichonephila clavipes]|nr:hypothetical protein TNCV_1149471 [Trichonephila clavipes]
MFLTKSIPQSPFQRPQVESRWCRSSKSSGGCRHLTVVQCSEMRIASQFATLMSSSVKMGSCSKSTSKRPINSYDSNRFKNHHPKYDDNIRKSFRVNSKLPGLKLRPADDVSIDSRPPVLFPLRTYGEAASVERLANQRLHLGRDEASDWLDSQRSTLAALVLVTLDPIQNYDILTPNPRVASKCDVNETLTPFLEQIKIKKKGRRLCVTRSRRMVRISRTTASHL